MGVNPGYCAGCVVALLLLGAIAAMMPRSADMPVALRQGPWLAAFALLHGSAELLAGQTVAEFVEDAKSFEMVRPPGVDLAQGCHLDRPCADHPALGPPAADET